MVNYVCVQYSIPTVDNPVTILPVLHSQRVSMAKQGLKSGPPGSYSKTLSTLLNRLSFLRKASNLICRANNLKQPIMLFYFTLDASKVIKEKEKFGI